MVKTGTPRTRAAGIMGQIRRLATGRERVTHGERASTIDYGDAKRMAGDADPHVRRKLAETIGVAPELLYYLAEDADPAVRRAVAANPGAPSQADRLLANDLDEDVRIEIARKIGRLAPELDRTSQDHLTRLTMEVLEVLAQDQLPSVRAIVAEEIKVSDSVPKPLVDDLARDAEIVVAGPILQYSPLLRDHDLLEIIRSGPVQGALTAIAQRRELAAAISHAIAETHDISAIETLLRNESAALSADTLDHIIERAPEVGAWHEPLALRRDLSPRAVQRIASFVSRSLLETLAQKYALSEEITRDIARAVSARLRGEARPPQAPVAGHDDAASAFAAGRLDETLVMTAVARGDRAFVVRALALRAEIPDATVERLLDAQAAKAITALAWKAHLSAGAAAQIQRRIADMPPSAVLGPSSGGRFALNREEMVWLLDFHGG